VAELSLIEDISTTGAFRMKWVTRNSAGVDRIACPWLVKRFIDPNAEFLYVAAPDVRSVAQCQTEVTRVRTRE
jgi:hypothetical protein